MAYNHRTRSRKTILDHDSSPMRIKARKTIIDQDEEETELSLEFLRMGLTSRRSRLHYDDFLKVFEEGRKDSYKPRKAQVRIVSYDKMSPEEAVTKLMDMVEAQTDVLQNAFGAFDKSECGRVSPSDFRRILDHFCYKMTNAQFKHLLSKLTIRGDNKVDYQIFLDSVRGSGEQDTDHWLQSIKQRLETRTPQLLTMEEVHEYLIELVTARFYHIARAFAEIDYAKIGVICKEDFKEVLYKYTMRLSDRQFEKLWLTLKVNDFDNIDYKDFLMQYTIQSGVTATPQPPYAIDTPTPRVRQTAALASYGRRPQTAESDVCRQIRSYETPNGRLSRAYTPLVNAENVERKLEDKVKKHWQVIQKQCRAFDTEDTGDISFSDFEYILSRSRISLTEDDMEKLLTKYELRAPGRFCYVEFIKHFVLNMGDSMAKEDSLMVRKKLHKARVPVSTGVKSAIFDDAMFRIRRCVLGSWKEMRREFRSIDRTGLGVLSPMKFRGVLRDFKVDLTEDEFYHLMSHYDKNMSGQISYNDFIAAFLKSA